MSVLLSHRSRFPLLLAAVFIGLAACADNSPVTVDDRPQLDVLANGALTNGDLQEEFSKLCKVGSSATFEATSNYVSPNPKAGTSTTVEVQLDDGECRYIAAHDGLTEFFDLTVTEISSPAGTVLDRIEILTDAGLSTVTGTNSVTTSVPPRHVITFFNRPVQLGRMTGGGAQIRIDDVRITRGLTLHCDIALSNNLEINWTGGNKWHLDKPITSASCLDDPAIDPLPPEAPFDTFIGEATGRLNGVDGSFVRFTFVDAGEPGSDDRASIMIWAPGADPSTDVPILEVSGLLDNGNLQAHFDQPHK